MADETQKVYCMPSSDNTALLAELINAKGNGTDAAEMAALFSNQNQNNWMNNPFMYLIWLAFFGGNGFGFGGNRADTAQNADLSRQLQTLQGTVADNHNSDLALQAINGNRDALGQLAQTFNTDLNSITAAVANVKSAIEQVGGQVGYSAESVKNAIALGDSNIVSKMQECCCANKLLVQQQGYENQLATERQTGLITSQMAAQHSAEQLQSAQNQSALLSRIDQLANGITQGFAQVGYATQQQTNEIVQAGNANTQRILDQMCANTTQQLRDTIADKDRQLQTQTLLNQLGGGCNCNS